MSPVVRNPIDGLPHRPPSRQDRNAFRIHTSVFILRLGSINRDDGRHKPRLHQVSLSAAGMGLHTNQTFRPNQRIMVEFALPPQVERVLYAHAEVVYAQLEEDGSTHVGLKFEWLSNEDERRLRDYCLAEERAFLRKELDKIGF